MGSDKDTDVPRSADLEPGFDEENPYENADLSSYPEWWRQSVKEFEEYGMRPYRPPRCEDGTILPEFISGLESELDVTIQLRGIDPRIGNDWSVFVDDERVTQISRERTGDGYTQYHVTAPEFEQLIRSGLTEDKSDPESDRNPGTAHDSVSGSPTTFDYKFQSESESKPGHQDNQ